MQHYDAERPVTCVVNTQSPQLDRLLISLHGARSALTTDDKGTDVRTDNSVTYSPFHYACAGCRLNKPTDVVGLTQLLIVVM